MVPALTLSVDDSVRVPSSHEAILDAIRAGDARRARSLMAEHVLDVQRRLEDLQVPGRSYPAE